MQPIIYTLDKIDLVAQQVIDHLPNKTVIGFKATMGTGKTTLISAIIRQLGVEDDINSPTFAIVNEYNTEDGKRILHMDLYRIKNAAEAFLRGIPDLFDSDFDYCFVEWPDQVEEIMPSSTQYIQIKTSEDGKRCLTWV
jgi:tRNA threonylcarbamoyladenosine biosynthesis protein TsaE